MILNRKTRARFFREIDAAFSNLMVLHDGRRVPYEGEELPQAFDYVAVTVEFAEIWFRFIRRRGELRTQVARPDEPYNWEELTLLWNPMATAECWTPPSAFRQLGDLLTRFETCWDRLVARLAHPN